MSPDNKSTNGARSFGRRLGVVAWNDSAIGTALEVMAYDPQDRFDLEPQPFDVQLLARSRCGRRKCIAILEVILGVERVGFTP